MAQLPLGRRRHRSPRGTACARFWAAPQSLPIGRGGGSGNRKGTVEPTGRTSRGQASQVRERLAGEFFSLGRNTASVGGRVDLRPQQATGIQFVDRIGHRDPVRHSGEHAARLDI